MKVKVVGCNSSETSASVTTLFPFVRNVNSTSLHRLIGAGAGIIFKGSGWYVKDSKAASSAGKTGKKESETSKDGKTEKASTDQASAEKSGASVSKDSSNKDSGGGNSKKDD